MRGTLLRFLLVAQCVIGLATSADAHGYKHKAIEIIHPWTFDRPEPGGRDAIVGMDIKNAGKQSDRLIGASSAAAARVEIRGTPGAPAGAAGTSAATVDVGPGTKVELGAKGPHLRLIGLKKALTAYDTLPVTLVFEKAGRMRIDVLVEEYSEPRN